LNNSGNGRQANSGLQWKLPTSIDLIPGGIDDFALAEGQAEEVCPQNADHEQQALARSPLIQVARAGNEPGQESSDRRLAEIDFELRIAWKRTSIHAEVSRTQRVD
jgi:hypothetical protein